MEKGLDWMKKGPDWIRKSPNLTTEDNGELLSKQKVCTYTLYFITEWKESQKLMFAFLEIFF